MVVNIQIVQVRRTRISERMRKLQELVPNMDKVDIIYEWVTDGNYRVAELMKLLSFLAAN